MSTSSTPTSSPRDISIDYLRTTLTLMVVAHHSSLAYTTFARFDRNNYLASTHPVVDSSRWLFLDYGQQFNDIFFMSLMFFISGLFVLPSLQRHGVVGFVRERFLRLGLPFAVFVVSLMPLAYYASWQLTANDLGFLAYWRRTFFSSGWPPGPLWFIWVLLMFNLIIALLGASKVSFQRLHAFHQFVQERAVAVAVVMILLCGLLLLPLLATFGSKWIALGTRPFYFELPRIGMYFAWFGLGALVGTAAVNRGLLAIDGALVRHWRWWIAATVIVFNLQWFVPRLLHFADLLTPYSRGAVGAILFVISCIASCFGFLALFRGAVSTRRRWMDSLTRSAYIIYIVHYVFVLWLQRAFMDQPWHAGLKFVAVFVGSVALSWLTAQLLLTSPLARRVL